MKRIVSLAALATALVTTPALAEDAKTPQQQADEFVVSTEAKLAKAGVEAAQASWVYSTYINQDTEAMTARPVAMLPLVYGSLVSRARSSGVSWRSTSMRFAPTSMRNSRTPISCMSQRAAWKSGLS